MMRNSVIEMGPIFVADALVSFWPWWSSCFSPVSGTKYASWWLPWPRNRGAWPSGLRVAIRRTIWISRSEPRSYLAEMKARVVSKGVEENCRGEFCIFYPFLSFQLRWGFCFIQGSIFIEKFLRKFVKKITKMTRKHLKRAKHPCLDFPFWFLLAVAAL